MCKGKKTSCCHGESTKQEADKDTPCCSEKEENQKTDVKENEDQEKSCH